MMMLSAVLVMVMLHSLNFRFVFDRFAEFFQQVDRNHVFVRRLCEGFLYPAVRLAADIDKHIRLRDFCNILNRGAVTVQVHAVIKQQVNIYVLVVASGDFFYPVVFGENRAYNVKFFSVSVCRCRSFFAGNRKSRNHQRRKKRGKIFLHFIPHNTFRKIF